jgi:hypothetical protein
VAAQGDTPRRGAWVAVLVVAGLLAVAYFVWPTPWERPRAGGYGVEGGSMEVRRHRLTGTVQLRRLPGGEWVDLPSAAAD